MKKPPDNFKQSVKLISRIYNKLEEAKLDIFQPNPAELLKEINIEALTQSIQYFEGKKIHQDSPLGSYLRKTLSAFWVAEKQLNTCTIFLEQAKIKEENSKMSLREFYAELQEVQEEFNDFHYKDKVLSIVTDPIALEYVDYSLALGKFQINLNISENNYNIEPLEPHWSYNKEYFHPHVSSTGDLCEGEARLPIENALKDFRLYDFFTVVTQTLKTYNPDGPYLEMEKWDYDDICSDCGESIDEENMFICDECEEHLCGDCANFCKDCEKDFCEGCYHTRICYICKNSFHECSYTTCNSCENITCMDCIETCPICETEVCPECICCCVACEESMCRDCAEECPHCGEPLDQDCLRNGDCPCHKEENKNDKEDREAI